MSWGSTIVLSGLVLILLFSLYTRLRGQSGVKKSVRNACASCGKRPSSTVHLKECTGCRVNLYCSDDCQALDWRKHKAFCKYIKSCRQTTRHDVLILPADGGPAYVHKLAFSVEAACFPSALFLRAPDVRGVFGSELDDTRCHRIEAKDQPEAENNGEYMMLYSMSTRLPPNKHLLYLLRLDELPTDRPFWHGDVVIVKTSDRFLQRPTELRELGGTAPEVDYHDVKMSFLPGVQTWMRNFFEVGFFDAVKNNDLFEKLKADDQLALRQRRPVTHATGA